MGYIRAMDTSTFGLLADPTRRRLIEALRTRDRTVGELVKLLQMSQPAVSKQLRILREAGLASVRVDAQRRIYRIEPAPFQAFDEWLEPYRQLWTKHLDALERHLDEQEKTHD